MAFHYCCGNQRFRGLGETNLKGQLGLGAET